MSDRVGDAPGGLGDFERALSKLRPRPSQVNRDRLMYAAGERAGQFSIQPRWGNFSLTTFLAAAAAALFAMIAVDARQQLSELRLAVSAPSNVQADSNGPQKVAIDSPQRAEKPTGTGSLTFIESNQSPVQAASASNSTNYVDLRNRMLRLGADTLAEATVPMRDKSKPDTEVSNDEHGPDGLYSPHIELRTIPRRWPGARGQQL